MIVIRPKPLRLRDADGDDLRYRVLVSGRTEGTVVRTLLAVEAHTLRTQAFMVRAIHAHGEAIQHTVAALHGALPGERPRVRGLPSAIDWATDGMKYDNGDTERRERK